MPPINKSVQSGFQGALAKPLGVSDALIPGPPVEAASLATAVMDGSYLASSLPASAAGASFVTWVRRTSTSVRVPWHIGDSFSGGGGYAWTYAGSSGRLIAECFGGTGNGQSQSNNNEFAAGGVWVPLFFSCRPGGNPQAYVGDTEITYSLRSFSANPLNFSSFNLISVGSSIASFGSRPGVNWQQDEADIWANFSVGFDWSVTENRRQFLTAAGRAQPLPVNGGVTRYFAGSSSPPVAVYPHFYFTVRDGEAIDQYRLNRGTIPLLEADNKLSVTSGTLQAASTSPA